MAASILFWQWDDLIYESSNETQAGKINQMGSRPSVRRKGENYGQYKFVETQENNTGTLLCTMHCASL